MWMAADLLRIALAGSILTVFFFGGWAVPYASQASIVSWFAELGEGIGSVVCLVLHVVSFVVKVSAFLFAFSAVRLALPRIDAGAAMRSCWRVILPLSIANVAFTALVLLAMERNP